MRGSTVLKLALIAAGVGLFIYVFSLNLSRGTTKLVLFGGLAVIAIGFVVVEQGVQKKRRAGVAAALEGRGFVLNSADGSPPVALHYRPEKDHSLFKPAYSALGLVGERPAHACEYELRIGRGKGAVYYHAFEAALDFPSALSLVLKPRLSAARRPISKMFAAPEPIFGSAELAKRWELECSDMDLGAALMSPGLAAWLAKAPVEERQWRVDGGWLSCTWTKQCQPEDLEPRFRRIEQFIELSSAGAGAVV
jgi:hypothetical protein